MKFYTLFSVALFFGSASVACGKEKGNRKGVDPATPIVVTAKVTPKSNQSTKLEEPAVEEVENIKNEVEFGTILVNVSGLPSSEGVLCYSLFAGAEGWPDNADKVVSANCFELGDNKFVTFTLDRVLPRDYGMAIYHDANRNGKLDKNIIGIPKEHMGFSNNAKIEFTPPGPPAYEKVKFDVPVGQNTTLDLKTFGLLD